LNCFGIDCCSLNLTSDIDVLRSGGVQVCRDVNAHVRDYS